MLLRCVDAICVCRYWCRSGAEWGRRGDAARCQPMAEQWKLRRRASSEDRCNGAAHSCGQGIHQGHEVSIVCSLGCYSCWYCPGHAAVAVLWTDSRRLSHILMHLRCIELFSWNFQRRIWVAEELGFGIPSRWIPVPVPLFSCPGCFYLSRNFNSGSLIVLSSGTSLTWEKFIVVEQVSRGTVPCCSGTVPCCETSLVLECFLVVVICFCPGPVNDSCMDYVSTLSEWLLIFESRLCSNALRA